MIENAWKRLITFGFRLLYNEMSWTYDLVSWLVSLGEWREWQRTALPYVRGKHVLEIGHGPGHMLATLLAAGYQVFGLDLSRHMGRLARKRISTPLVTGNAQELPFATAVFDTVLSTFPTEYIVLPETVQSVFRVLKSEGVFIIIPEGHLTGTTPLHRFIEWLFFITGQRQDPFAVDETQHWPPEDQRQLFERHFQEAGFQVNINHVELDRSAVSVVIARKL